MKHLFLALLFSVLLFVGCTEKKEEIKLAKAAIYFEPVPSDSSGVDFSNDLYYLEDLNIIEYLYYYNGGGVAIGDINNDGLEDIYLTANQTPDRLYLNLGGMKFKDITEASGMKKDSSWSTGVTMEDVNNDGFLDIYVSKVGNYKNLKAHNLLYINEGGSQSTGQVHFKESSSDYGLDFSGLSTQASFFDYDKDGDMDMYLMNHSVHTPKSYGDIRKRQEKDSLAGDLFYENRLEKGITKFADVTEASGILSSALGYGLALTTADINNDGWTDIYVGNDFHENDYIYINQGDKTFKESISSYLNHTTRFTMGVDIADINNDQLPDIFSLDMMPFDKEIFLKSAGEDSDKVTEIKRNFGFENQYARNMLQLNSGKQSFTDIALMTETHATDWSWSALLQDFDNDGLTDIYVTNGIYKRPNDLNYVNYISNVDFAQYEKTQQGKLEQKLIAEMPTINIPNVVFRNTGNLEFERLTAAAGQTPSYSNGAAYADLDNDGDLDIVVNNINQEASILENKSSVSQTNNFISIALQGDDILRNPNGTKVTVFSNGVEFYQESNVTKGFQSASSKVLHFGLGTLQKIDSVQVQWMDNTIQSEKGLAINQKHSIARNAEKLELVPPKKEVVSETFQTFPFIHQENRFFDYELEPLMPEKLSTEGPALVKADFNGDGLQDLFIGGARNQSPALFIKQKNGSYLSDKESAFIKDILYEDVDATAFDLENDGDLDLYVMSGGNDRPDGDQFLEDRIYINDGNAKFERLKASLIKTNGGSVSSADFDGDGFTDLFIGNRSMPEGYGLAPFSYLLKNDGKGSFGIVQKGNLGMITDSQWADINNDGLLDLVAVGDWMPITLLINQGNGSFLDQTKDFGLTQTQGLWNTVLVTDINNDGKNDILGGNAGLNLKWKASKERPVKLYIDDYDDNGQPEPIIFYDFFGQYVPFASRDKLVERMPSLKKKFLNYEDFAKIENITDLTGKMQDSILEIKNISELRSMLYINQGSGFEEVPLPKEAQMSAIQDFQRTEKNGKSNLLFISNYLGYAAEMGQSDGNSGGMFALNEAGKFESFQWLPLPNNLNTRKIVKLNENSFLVISSDDKTYILEL